LTPPLFARQNLPVSRQAVGDVTHPHHPPVFDIDERALPVGVAILAETARRFLAGL
jgi:metal-dependent amidase/aminoacylase/carboxypeptidase family protein